VSRRADPRTEDRSRAGSLVHSAMASGRHVTVVAYIEGPQGDENRYAIESTITCRTSEQANEIARVLREAPPDGARGE